MRVFGTLELLSSVFSVYGGLRGLGDRLTLISELDAVEEVHDLGEEAALVKGDGFFGER